MMAKSGSEGARNQVMDYLGHVQRVKSHVLCGD